MNYSERYCFYYPGMQYMPSMKAVLPIHVLLHGNNVCMYKMDLCHHWSGVAPTIQEYIHSFQKGFDT